jgi:hypothetical protein
MFTAFFLNYSFAAVEVVLFVGVFLWRRIMPRGLDLTQFSMIEEMNYAS